MNISYATNIQSIANLSGPDIFLFASKIKNVWTSITCLLLEIQGKIYMQN